jgi:GT2 family glycosyltransferase
MVEVAENDDRVGILSPIIGLVKDEDRIVFPLRVHYWSPIIFFHVGTLPLFEIFKSPPLEGVRRVGTVDGCCFLAKRQMVEQVGLFDSRYFFGGYESLDLVLKAERRGYLPVIVPGAHIWASRGDRRLKSLLYSYWSPRNRVIFANSNLPPKHRMLFWLTLPLYIVSWILVWGVLGARIREVVFRISEGIRDGLKSSRVSGHPI